MVTERGDRFFPPKVCFLEGVGAFIAAMVRDCGVVDRVKEAERLPGDFAFRIFSRRSCRREDLDAWEARLKIRCGLSAAACTAEDCQRAGIHDCSFTAVDLMQRKDMHPNVSIPILRINSGYFIPGLGVWVGVGGGESWGALQHTTSNSSPH